MDKFALEDCIKRFLAPEHVDNYSCSRCWHIAAVKYLSSFGGQQEDISKLNCCSRQGSCDCRNISSLQTLPWSNHFSHAFKQLSMAHCPQILCLHLQRSSLNAFGEVVKIQGHISFPMILNLSSFAKYEVGIHKQKTNKPKSLAEKQVLASTTCPRSVNMDADSMTTEASRYFSEPCSLVSGTCSNSKVTHTTLEDTNGSAPSKSILYRLVSVAEHFGRAGSGHYTVYRGVTTQTKDVSETKTHLQWFRISDSEVHTAAEEDVLGAEATLLFYERI
ncbi:Ubiquitin carboxyl-terminal hydrolase 27 [Bienertia sinuspersici]